jgi:hypothetical protein
LTVEKINYFYHKLRAKGNINPSGIKINLKTGWLDIKKDFTIFSCPINQDI